MRHSKKQLFPQHWFTDHNNVLINRVGVKELCLSMSRTLVGTGSSARSISFISLAHGSEVERIRYNVYCRVIKMILSALHQLERNLSSASLNHVLMLRWTSCKMFIFLPFLFIFSRLLFLRSKKQMEKLCFQKILITERLLMSTNCPFAHCCKKANYLKCA